VICGTFTAEAIKCCSSQRNSVPPKVRLRLTMSIKYGLRPALHMIARRADRPAAISLGIDKACDAKTRQRAALDGYDVACCAEYQRP
jgi:hypothetical protein